MPYCTLCRSVQAYFTDRAADFKPLLRTSGLLSRSNKFMYDLRTFSAIDTFTGQAISGPLHRANVVLPQATVVISTWAAWRMVKGEFKQRTCCVLLGRGDWIHDRPRRQEIHYPDH